MPYTAEQKAEAVRLYLEHGATHAAEQVGCTRRQVYRWLGSHGVSAKKPEERHAETLARHQAKREALRELLLDKAADLIQRMDDPHYDYRGKDASKVHFDKATSGDVRAYATAAAILIDKYRLEMGEATARTHWEGSDDIDRSVSQLVAELERRAQAEIA